MCVKGEESMDDFILKLPNVEADNYFTYDVVMFILLWILLAAGILLCFWGYKYVQALVLLVLGSLCGVAGIMIADTMTQNAVLKMSFFVMFTFFGVCMLYLFSIILGVLLRKLGIREKLFKKIYLLTAILGGALTGGTVYLWIFRNVWVAVLGVGLAVIGIIYGRKKAADRKPFYTYEDLYRMKPLEEGGTDA